MEDNGDGAIDNARGFDEPNQRPFNQLPEIEMDDKQLEQAQQADQQDVQPQVTELTAEQLERVGGAVVITGAWD